MGILKLSMILFPFCTGEYEARLPMMYGIFPRQFREKYPEAFNNFKFNSKNRMTSPFDIYYTLKAIVSKDYSTPNYDPKDHYGMNLFGKYTAMKFIE